VVNRRVQYTSDLQGEEAKIYKKMEILNSNMGLLSNLEVLDLLREKHQGYPTHDQCLDFIYEAKVKSGMIRAEDEEKPVDAGTNLLGKATTEKEDYLPTMMKNADETTIDDAIREEGWSTLQDLKRMEDFIFVRDKTIAYLENTAAANQSAEIIKNFFSLLGQQLPEVKITSAELLQLVNLRPASCVEIHKIIEECEERISEV
jgi:hypothetical protein